MCSAQYGCFCSSCIIILLLLLLLSYYVGIYSLQSQDKLHQGTLSLQQGIFISKKNLRNFNTNNIIFQYLTFELDSQTFKTISSEFISHLPVTVLSELHLHVLFNSLFARNVRFRPPVSLSPILCLCVYSLI
jgi:hypothetical protein